MAQYTLNEELNGIEISFDSKPDTDTLNSLKSAGYRWHKVKKVWYAKQTADRLTLAESLAGLQEVPQESKPKLVYLLSGEAKKEYINNYSFVVNSKDDGTKHQFTKGGWIDYFNKKDYIHFAKSGLTVAIDRPSIDSTIYYDDEYDSPINADDSNKKEVFIRYNMSNFNDFRIYDWMQSRIDLETIGCCSGLWSSQPVLIEYPHNGDNNEVHIDFTSRREENTPDNANVIPLDNDEIEALKTIVDELKAAYMNRLETYYKRYSKNIYSYGYWANR